MKLYYVPRASPLAVHIVLEWCGLPYEAVRMDRDSIKAPSFTALNANGTVPVLVDGDFCLCESIAILGYLADLCPASRLVGDGSPRARAEVVRWLAHLNSDVRAAFQPIFKASYFVADASVAADVASMGRRHVHAYLKHLDDRLDGRDWLTGERSIADPYLFVILRWAITQEVGLHDFDHLRRFMRRMESDAGVRSALWDEERIALS